MRPPTSTPLTPMPRNTTNRIFRLRLASSRAVEKEMNHTGISRTRKYVMGMSTQMFRAMAAKISAKKAEYSRVLKTSDEKKPERKNSAPSAAAEKSRVA